VESRTQAFECAYAPAVSAKASVRKQEINRPEDLLEVEALLAGGPLGILHLLEGSRSPGRTTEDASRIPLQVRHGPRWLVSFRPLAPGTLQTWRPGTRVARTRRCSEAGTRPCGMRPVTSGSNALSSPSCASAQASTVAVRSKSLPGNGKGRGQAKALPHDRRPSTERRGRDCRLVARVRDRSQARLASAQ